MFKADQKIPNLLRGGLKEQIVKTSPYGPAVSDKAKQAAEAVKVEAGGGQLRDLQG